MERSSGKARFPIEVLGRLVANREVTYCVLHGWDHSAACRPGDADVAMSFEDLVRMERRLQGMTNVRVVQLFQHEHSGYYFVLAVRESGAVHLTAIDVAVDYRLGGRIFFTGEQLLQDSRQVNGIRVAAPGVELAYLLTKKISKGKLPGHQKARLQVLWQTLGSAGPAVARTLFGHRWGDRVGAWLSAGDWSALERALGRLRRALRWHSLTQDPLAPVRYWASEIRRLCRRWLRPTGFTVAVLGPDGSGKSTLIDRLEEQLGTAFRHTAVFHWRAPLRRATPRASITNPHGRPCHPLWLSILKIWYCVLTYRLGQVLVVRPRLVRSTLVLFDRYYDDLLVDPRRYRYAGPLWLSAVLRRFVPRPDLLLVLDVPEDELLRRKREVSREELIRQRAAYRRLARASPGAVLLDGSLAADEIARRARDVVLDCLGRRYRNRRRVWFGNSDAGTLAWIAAALGSSHPATVPTLRYGAAPRSHERPAYRWLSLGDGRGYLFPVEPVQAATKCLELYNAQAVRARLVKQTVGMGIRLGLGRFVLPTVYLASRNDNSHDGSPDILDPSLLRQLERVLGHEDLRIAISAGTPGRHRKLTLLAVRRDGPPLAYVKLGSDSTTNMLVQREADTLERLSRLSYRGITVARLLHAGWWNGRYMCVQSPLTPVGAPALRTLTPQCLDVVRDLARLHAESMRLAESAFGRTLSRQIEMVPNAHHRDVLRRGLAQVTAWLGETRLPFHLCHGDFTPWNIKCGPHGLLIFDWEYADWSGPPGLDAFHFIYETMRLLEKRRPSEIYGALLRDPRLLAHLDVHFGALGLTHVPRTPLWLLYRISHLAQAAIFEEGPAFDEIRALAETLDATVATSAVRC